MERKTSVGADDQNSLHLAIIVPRYGPESGGGAESQARGFAEESMRRGWRVEIWTSCAQDHFTWENTLAPGLSSHNGVPIYRFPITSRNAGRQTELETKISAQGRLSLAEQYDWLAAGAHSLPLYEHVSRKAETVDAIIALPYASPLVHYAAWLSPSNTILWPCLHDEPYAYMEPVRLLMETVWGVMFNSPEEGTLATSTLSIHPRHVAVLGEGVELPTAPSRLDGGLGQYLGYISRLEEGKNVRTLYDYTERYFEAAEEAGRPSVRLIVAGKGPLRPPDHPAFDFRGFVSDEEKATICEGALAVCQPSLNESFSLIIMESWLAGRPVLVSEACAVTREHVRRSKGGLWFCGYEEFAGAVDWFLDNPAKAQRMGANGRRYVRGNYSWESVGRRFYNIFRGWQESAVSANGVQL